jgi:hypothetical protein
MLTYAVTQSDSEGASKGGSAPVKVLLVSDWIENLPRVKSALRLAQHHITYAQTAADLNRACRDFYDFVVVDVGPEHIVYALRELRASTQLHDTPVLVRAERLAQAFELTSVFAKYRAMPGLDSERLAQEFAMASMFAKYRAMPGLDVQLAKLVSVRAQEKRTPGAPSPNDLSPGHSLL